MHDRIALGGESPADRLAALFDTIETRGVVPGASSRAIGPDEATFRAMYLDLDAVREALRAADLAPRLVTVCADVLHIPDRFDWPLRQIELVIVARRIHSDGYATIALDYRDDTAASLTVFTETVSGRFQAIAATAPDGPQPAAFIFDAPPATGGVRIHVPGREPVETALDCTQDLPARAVAVLEQALRAELSFASVLRDQHPALAQAMLGWIRTCSGGLPGMGWMAAELGSLVTSQAGTASPPRLAWTKTAWAAAG
ncbi:hypothetical protein [Inquilinus sp. Marseille-Q2685]|uniref:hypothetical protein n=1 Tax=Inquilinus sp. Marseille-Q2685 TaxID=2866581 RepID=UPI001CE3CCFD|nr:hypothetical protein [Inquilinus sp. Marseille-Q2685]